MIMRATSILSLTVFLTLGLSGAASAEGLTYFEDPIYEKLSPQDHHPMDDMILYAQAGDTRAQFILGDMYAKGKGGFDKNEKKAREWFEMAARNGETYSFIRLAALAKHHGDWTEAYQWYSLAVDASPYGSDERKWPAAQKEKLEDEKKVTKDDIKTAKKNAADWREKSKELLKADLELQKQKEPEAEALALQDNLEPEKNAAAAAEKAEKKDAQKKAAPPKEDVKKEEPKPEVKAETETKADVKPEAAAEAKTEVKAEEAKPAAATTTEPTEGEKKND